MEYLIVILLTEVITNILVFSVINIFDIIEYILRNTYYAAVAFITITELPNYFEKKRQERLTKDIILRNLDAALPERKKEILKGYKNKKVAPASNKYIKREGDFFKEIEKSTNNVSRRVCIKNFAPINIDKHMKDKITYEKLEKLLDKDIKQFRTKYKGNLK